MTTASEQLARYGYTLAEAYGFIMAFESSPNTIYQAALSAQLTTTQLTEILQAYAPHITQAQVRGYFSAAQLNPDTLDENLLLQQAQSHQATQLTYDIAALLPASHRVVLSLNSDTKWPTTTLTYGFNSSIPAEYYGVRLSASAEYGNLTTGWQTPSSSLRNSAEQIMNDLNLLTGLQITRVNHNQADIRVNMIPTDNNTAAFAYYPGTGLGGDIFVDTNIRIDTLAVGQYGYFTVAHELGHALGLKHPFEDGITLATNDDHHIHSIMSYTDFRPYVPVFSHSGNSVSVNYNSIYPSGFMVYDLAALQAMYGVNSQANSQDNTYRFTTDPVYTTLWDAGGIDTLDLTATTHSNTVRLTSGSYSDMNQRDLATQMNEGVAYLTQLGSPNQASFVQNALTRYADQLYTGEKALGIAYGTVIENALGGSANDTFYDNAVDNWLSGGAGNDRFYLGSGGFDKIEGGDGWDEVILPVAYAQVQMQQQGSQKGLLVAENFAATLIGIESIRFSDQSMAL